MLHCTKGEFTHQEEPVPDFTRMPEAIDFVAGQAWLSPNLPLRAAASVERPRTDAGKRLSWGTALRDIAAILRRVG